MKTFFYSIALTVTIVFSGVKLTAQNTPQALGEKVFNCFKMKNHTELCTMILSTNEQLELNQYRGIELAADRKENFAKKHVFHVDKFKNKCYKLMNDTSAYMIDWTKANYEKSASTPKTVLTKLDSTGKQANITTNPLEIYFSAKGTAYVMQFENIYLYNGVWKLGDTIRIRKVE